jgi:hypothetical protein
MHICNNPNRQDFFLCNESDGLNKYVCTRVFVFLKTLMSFIQIRIALRCYHSLNMFFRHLVYHSIRLHVYHIMYRKIPYHTIINIAVKVQFCVTLCISVSFYALLGNNIQGVSKLLRWLQSAIFNAPVQSKQSHNFVHVQKHFTFCLHVFNMCTRVTWQISRRYWNSSHVCCSTDASTSVAASEIWSRSSGKDCGAGVCRRSPWRNQGKRSQEVTGPGILVAKVTVPRAISNFRTADYREILSRPSCFVRVNGQESPPSVGAITNARAYPGM